MRRVALLLLVLHIIMCGIVICGCRKKVVVERPPGPPAHAKAYGLRAKYLYWYYPGSEIYYCPETKIYATMEGGEWVTAKSPRAGVVLGSHVVIESDTDKPWLKHSEHKAKYPPGKGKRR